MRFLFYNLNYKIEKNNCLRADEITRNVSDPNAIFKNNEMLVLSSKKPVATEKIV